LEAIEKSKTQPLSRLIYGLGIRHIGEKCAYVLAQRFKTLDNLTQAKLEDFDAIYEVGQVMANSIVEFFRQDSTHRLILKLKSAGLNLKEETVVSKETALTGKTIVFTGELESYSRSEAKRIARQYGGNVSLGVTKNTDFVIVGLNPGSKYDKAKKLGVKIIDEEKFSRLISS